MSIVPCGYCGSVAGFAVIKISGHPGVFPRCIVACKTCGQKHQTQDQALQPVGDFMNPSKIGESEPLSTTVSK